MLDRAHVVYKIKTVLALIGFVNAKSSFEKVAGQRSGKQEWQGPKDSPCLQPVNCEGSWWIECVT